jgi:hypothetical protein
MGICLLSLVFPVFLASVASLIAVMNVVVFFQNDSRNIPYASSRPIVTKLDPDAPLREGKPLHDIDMVCVCPAIELLLTFFAGLLHLNAVICRTNSLTRVETRYSDVECCFGRKYNFAEVTFFGLLYTLMQQIQSGTCLCQGLEIGVMFKLWVLAHAMNI